MSDRPSYGNLENYNRNLEEQLATKDAEIERLKEEHANCPPHTGIGDRGWMEECKRAEKKLEALNAFLAAFDRNWVQGFVVVSIRNVTEITEARAALEEYYDSTGSKKKL